MKPRTRTLRHKGHQRPQRAVMAPTTITTPNFAWLDAEVRLDTMEEASRLDVAAGQIAFRIRPKQAKPSRFSLPKPGEIVALGGLFGPDGKPLRA